MRNADCKMRNIIKKGITIPQSEFRNPHCFSTLNLDPLNPKDYIVNEQIFREYDIRGVVGVDLTPEVVENLGRAVGTYLLRQVSPG